MNLDEARTWAMLMLDEHGLIERGWTVTWDNARRRAGICRHNMRTIGFSGGGGFDPARFLQTLHAHRPHSLILLPQMLLALVGAAEQGLLQLREPRTAHRAADVADEHRGDRPAGLGGHPQRAKEFARLNALLADLRVDEPQESIEGEAPDAPYRKGETVGYDEGKARVEKALKMNNGKPVYLVRQKAFTEMVLEDELEPTNAAQRKRLSLESKKEKEVPVAKPNTAVMAKIRLAKAKKAKKLKLLQLAEAA